MRERRLDRQQSFDRAAAHGDGVVLEDRAGRFHRHDPAGVEEKLSFYLGVP
jgi:hypothetical protein